MRIEKWQTFWKCLPNLERNCPFTVSVNKRRYKKITLLPLLSIFYGWLDIFVSSSIFILYFSVSTIDCCSIIYYIKEKETILVVYIYIFWCISNIGNFFKNRLLRNATPKWELSLRVSCFSRLPGMRTNHHFL